MNSNDDETSNQRRGHGERHEHGTAHERAMWPARARHGRIEHARDRAWLAWIGRFRFVTVTELAARFDVTPQRARVRVRRLADAGLVRCRQSHVAQAFAIHLTSRGATLLGVPAPTRPPRIDVQREHELAIAGLVAQLERDVPTLTVFTERDARQAEALGQRRCSIPVVDDRGRPGRRWPDLLLLGDEGPVAVELELTMKSADRLRRIVTGYAGSGMAEVRWLVTSPALARRLRRLADTTAKPLTVRRLVPVTRFVITPWLSVGATTAAEIARLGAARPHA